MKRLTDLGKVTLFAFIIVSLLTLGFMICNEELFSTLGIFLCLFSTTTLILSSSYLLARYGGNN